MTDESTKVFQDEANETTQENNNKTRKIATAAGIAAGALGVGGAVGYAATHESDKPVEVPQDPVPEEPTPEPKVVERVIVREAPAAQPAPQSAPQEDDNQIVYDVDNAEVEVIEVGQTGEGSYYATAQIDGHAAVFVDGDSNGTVDVLGIDVNNNGSLENNEVMDISDRNISMHSLASAAPANPGPTPVGPTPVGSDSPGINVSELHVGQVAHDVEVNGQTADMATVEYRGHAGVIADVNQDGRGDAALIDMNDNGSFEEQEVFDIRQSNVSMNDNNTIPVNDSEINASEIQVGQVAYDVEVNGQTADMATAEYRGHAGVIADINQDGRGDAAFIDMNDSGSFENQEIYDIRQSNVSMDGNNTGAINVADPQPVAEPIADPEPEPQPEPEPEPEPEPYIDPMGEPDPLAATDGLPDYTNGGDVDGYII